jgi:hypothetical protein
MPTSGFLDSMYVAHNELCAFGPVGATVIAFNVLESLLQQLSRPRLLKETFLLSSNG